MQYQASCIYKGYSINEVNFVFGVCHRKHCLQCHLFKEINSEGSFQVSKDCQCFHSMDCLIDSGS